MNNINTGRAARYTFSALADLGRSRVADALRVWPAEMSDWVLIVELAMSCTLCHRSRFVIARLNVVW